ncbi:MAG: hypothetical protein U9R24_04250 [Thermodesulfobacteriota bacterium]|nr:hypothetical protein [Thermodesulfobacteriota bacterium]
MKQKMFYRRVLIPIGIVTLLMVLSINVYNISPAVGVNHPGLGRILSTLSALFMFISIWMGAFIAHPMAFRAGASMGERVFAGLATPLIWSAKMVYYAGCVYSGWELVYWCFHPLIVGVISVALLNMGISEIICRLAYRREARMPEKILQGPVIIMLLIGLTIVPLSLWNGGTFFFYIFVDIYTMLFH